MPLFLLRWGLGGEELSFIRSVITSGGGLGGMGGSTIVEEKSYLKLCVREIILETFFLLWESRSVWLWYNDLAMLTF